MLVCNIQGRRAFGISLRSIQTLKISIIRMNAVSRIKILTCLSLFSFFIAQPSYAGCKSDCEEQYHSARDDCNSQYDSPDDADALQSCIDDAKTAYDECVDDCES